MLFFLLLLFLLSLQQLHTTVCADPQVKVAGLPANIQRARELILQDLDAKSTRVTLKLDVAFSEHSHVIGKEGANIKKGTHGNRCRYVCRRGMHGNMCC